MTIDDMISVLRAAKEGKAVEFSMKGRDLWSNNYSIVENGWFDSQCFDYRIKPDPREVYLQHIGGGLWQEKFKGVATRFREVLE
jgi:hypothetical protein